MDIIEVIGVFFATMTPAYRAFVEEGSLMGAINGDRPEAAEDLARAQAAIDSEDSWTCMEGCWFTLKCSAEEVTPRLVAALERLASAEPSVRSNLALAMHDLPISAFRDYPQLSRFILAAALDPESAVNAATVVGRLAGCGNTAAREVFMELKKSATDHVRNNAINEYNRICASRMLSL